MVVVGIKKITDFAKEHPDCCQVLSELVRELENAHIRTPQELKDRYPTCKIVDGNTVVFKVRGNRYRLSATIAYAKSTVVVIAVESHADYDKRRLK